MMVLGALLLVLTAGATFAQGTTRGEAAQATADSVQTQAVIFCSQQAPRTDECDGTRQDDVIFGTSGRDEIGARGGDDTVFGGDGDDTINGARGDDRLSGGDGDDTISDTATNDEDIVSGGSGNDEIDVADDDRDDTVTCGSGRDRVRADRGDDVDSSCERINRE